MKKFKISPSNVYPKTEVDVAIDFLIHEPTDGVAVALIEGVKAGQKASGWVTQEDETITVKLLNDIPIGHKVALQEITRLETLESNTTPISAKWSRR